MTGTDNDFRVLDGSAHLPSRVLVNQSSSVSYCTCLSLSAHHILSFLPVSIITCLMKLDLRTEIQRPIQAADRGHPSSEDFNRRFSVVPDVSVSKNAVLSHLPLSLGKQIVWKTLWGKTLVGSAVYHVTRLETRRRRTKQVHRTPPSMLFSVFLIGFHASFTREETHL
jgi:hypothetical protein